MWVDQKSVDDRYRCFYVMLIHESHVFELQSDWKFEVCDPCSFFNATYAVMRKTWKIQT